MVPWGDGVPGDSCDKGTLAWKKFISNGHTGIRDPNPGRVRPNMCAAFEYIRDWKTCMAYPIARIPGLTAVFGVL